MRALGKNVLSGFVVAAFLLGGSVGALCEEKKEMKKLPNPSLKGGVSVEEALARRRSVRAFRDGALSDGEIAQLLWAAQGVTDPERSLRSAPSAGATYPLETYLATCEGVFRYIPGKHALEPVKSGDCRPALAEAALGQSCVQRAAAVFVFAAADERTTGRYGQRGIMYVHMEAGHAAQNLHLQAVALGLGSVPVGAFDESRSASVLGTPAGQRVLYMVPVGRPE